MLLTRRGRAILDAMTCFEQAVDARSAAGRGARPARRRSSSHRTLRPVARQGIDAPRSRLRRARARDRSAIRSRRWRRWPTSPRRTTGTSRRPSRSRIAPWRSIRRMCAPWPSAAISLVVLEALPLAQQQRILDDIRRARELDPLNAWVDGGRIAVPGMSGTPAGSRRCGRTRGGDGRRQFHRAMDAGGVAGDGAAGTRKRTRQPLPPSPCPAVTHGSSPSSPTFTPPTARRTPPKPSMSSYETARAAGHVGFAERAAVAASAGHVDEARAPRLGGDRGARSLLEVLEVSSMASRVERSGMHGYAESDSAAALATNRGHHRRTRDASHLCRRLHRRSVHSASSRRLAALARPEDVGCVQRTGSSRAMERSGTTSPGRHPWMASASRRQSFRAIGYSSPRNEAAASSGRAPG